MSKTKKTTQTREIPAWLERGSRQATDLASRIATRPYQGFEDPRIAQLSGAERVAGERALEQGQDYQTDLARSRELTEQGAGSFLDADIQGYMNPYIEGALEPAAREIREEALRRENRAAQEAGMASAFGGARATLKETETARGGLEELSDFYARGHAGAFESARDQFNRDRDVFARGAEQYRATGAQGQQQLTQDIQNLLTTGGLQRNLEQAGIDFDYAQFIENRDWDVTNLQPLLATLSSVPHGETQTTTQKSSAIGSILGAAATVAAAYFTGGASLAAAGASGGILKKVGVGFGDMMGGEGAGMAAFGGQPGPTQISDIGAGGGYAPPAYLPGAGGSPYGAPAYAPGFGNYQRAA